MNVLKKVRDTINSLTQDISDKEFFSGREFREFIMASLKTALGELARRTVSLEIFYNEHSDMTACTNGEVILANAGDTSPYRYKRRSSGRGNAQRQVSHVSRDAYP